MVDASFTSWKRQWGKVVHPFRVLLYSPPGIYKGVREDPVSSFQNYVDEMVLNDPS